MSNADINLIKQVANILETSQGHITMTQFNIIKPIFLLSQFNNLPPSCFLPTANLLKIARCQPGEIIIQSSNKEPDPCFIVDGYLYINNKDKQIAPKKLANWWKRSKDDYLCNSPKIEQEKIKYLLPPSSIVGSFYKLDGHSWDAVEIIALEQSVLITLSMKGIENIMKDTASSSQSTEIIEFLYGIIPIFNTLGKYKTRFMSSIVEKEFNMGTSIFNDGTPANYTYLLKEGDVQIVSTNGVSIFKNEHHSPGRKNSTDTLQSKRGFLSQTLSSYQLGIVSKGQWIEDDFILIPHQQNYLYTAIASTKVKAYEFSKIEYDVMPSELKHFFIEQCKQRMRWIMARIDSINNKLNDVIKIDDVKYDEKVIDAKKKFPNANSDMLSLICKKSMLMERESLSLHKTSTLPSSPKRINTFKLPSPFLPTESNTLCTFLTATDPKPLPSKTSYHEKSKLQTIFNMTTRRSQSIATYPSKYFPDRSKLCMAATSREINKLMPTFPRTNRRKQNLQLDCPSCYSTQYGSLYSDIKSSLAKKNLNKFMIGKKIVNLLDLDPGRYKITTPNPFSKQFSNVRYPK